MKAFEFKSKLKGNAIQIPENIGSKLSGAQEVKVILLYEDSENHEENAFKSMAKEQFFEGYSQSDSVYDNE